MINERKAVTRDLALAAGIFDNMLDAYGETTVGYSKADVEQNFQALKVAFQKVEAVYAKA